MLDPIADKLIVGAALMMLVHDNTINGWSIWAAIVILCREILVSGLREFLAELNVKVHVTQLAKWKTAMQMVALAVLLAGPAADKIVPGITASGLVFSVDRGAPYALDRLRLSEGGDPSRHGAVKRRDPEHAAPSGRLRAAVKLRYFAWVREKTGRAEEEIVAARRRRDRGSSSSAGSSRADPSSRRPSAARRRARRRRPDPTSSPRRALPARARSPSSRP